MIERLKNVIVAKYNSEELIALRAEARMLENEYNVQKLTVPAWLDEAAVNIEIEMKRRFIDEKKRQLAQAQSLRASLATPEEKRDRLDKQISDLLAEIAKA